MYVLSPSQRIGLIRLCSFLERGNRNSWNLIFPNYDKFLFAQTAHVLRKQKIDEHILASIVGLNLQEYEEILKLPMKSGVVESILERGFRNLFIPLGKILNDRSKTTFILKVVRSVLAISDCTDILSCLNKTKI